jgi:predicted metalloprotease
MRAIAILALTVLLAGCGAQETLEDARQQVAQLRERADEYRDRADDLRREVSDLPARVRQRVRETLEELEQAVPEASLPEPSSGDRTDDTAVERFLTRTLRSVDTYWTRTLTEAGRPELQADCLAGAWGNAVYREGGITEEDVQEALSTALAAGDFEVGSEQHHGTPAERRDAWLLGWSTGEPAECTRFVAA